MVKPTHEQVPVFLSRHVLVKVLPAGTRALSGIVTSSSSTAPFLHGADFDRLLASVINAGPGVEVGEDVTTLVGGSVEVTKTGAEGVSVSTESEMQELREIERRKDKNRIFLMV